MAKSNKGFTWQRAFAIVTIRAMEKGQLPLLLFGTIILLSIYKMDGKAIAEMWNKVIDALLSGNLFLLLSIFVLLLLWYLHSRSTRKRHRDECSRIGNQKSQLQKQLANQPLGSSHDKK